MCGRYQYNQCFEDCISSPNDPVSDDALCYQVSDEDENIASEYLFGINFNQDADDEVLSSDIGDHV